VIFFRIPVRLFKQMTESFPSNVIKCGYPIPDLRSHCPQTIIGGPMRRILCSRSFVVLLVLFLLSSVSYAQSGRSTVRGTVRDQQGNLIAGATVTLENTEKNFNRTQTTTQEGTYVFTAVPPGTYTLDVEATGFK